MRFLRDNGLTLVLMGVFLATAVGMFVTGWLSENHGLTLHGQPVLGQTAYFFSGAFQSALFEIPADGILCDANRRAVPARIVRV